MFWLKTVRLCEAFGTMPSAGGLFNQPSRYINRMYTVLTARTAVEQENAEKEKARAKARKAASRL